MISFWRLGYYYVRIDKISDTLLLKVIMVNILIVVMTMVH